MGGSGCFYGDSGLCRPDVEMVMEVDERRRRVVVQSRTALTGHMIRRRVCRYGLLSSLT